MSNIITVSNVTDFQYQWLIAEAKRKSLSLAAVVKIWLQDKAEQERMAQDLNKIK